MTETKTKSAKIGLVENFTYRLFDKDGKRKKIFQLNAAGLVAMRKGEIHPHSCQQMLAEMGLGHFADEMKVKNLITTTGKAGVASRINGAGSEAAFTYLAIGTGTTAANVADTTLETEISTGGGSRAAATCSRTTTDTTNDTARMVYTWTFSGSFAVTEAGVLNAASSGTLLNRQVFTAVNVVSGDSLQVTVDVDVD